MSVLMPDFSRTPLSNLAMVDDTTGLWGLTSPKNSFFSPFCGLQGSVTFSYALRVSTGQSALLCANLAKKNSVLAFTRSVLLGKIGRLKTDPLWEITTKTKI